MKPDTPPKAHSITHEGFTMAAKPSMLRRSAVRLSAVLLLARLSRVCVVRSRHASATTNTNKGVLTLQTGGPCHAPLTPSTHVYRHVKCFLPFLACRHQHQLQERPCAQAAGQHATAPGVPRGGAHDRHPPSSIRQPVGWCWQGHHASRLVPSTAVWRAEPARSHHRPLPGRALQDRQGHIRACSCSSSRRSSANSGAGLRPGQSLCVLTGQLLCLLS